MKFHSLVVAALAAALCVGVTACAPPPVTSDASTVDVQFGGDLGNIGRMPACGVVAQTFTAGRTGVLDKVSLDVGRAGPVPVSVLIQITTLDGMGRPTSTVIGSASFYEFTGGLHDAQLDVPAPVVAGTGYALTVRDPEFCFENGLSLGAAAPTYDGGRQFAGSGDPLLWSTVDTSELVFRTWVR